ncbi:hypothetical protein AVEN_157320-1 [Araneus ventricosus]|uniref:Uncharacterized protein n=1 Tax=Araneus ventricosus TaxID=182803 RepID=A0A4Y2NSB5_ARAVE|nr:hypothetical protein AVEN_157320-1 [Araneus ventricosus]
MRDRSVPYFKTDNIKRCSGHAKRILPRTFECVDSGPEVFDNIKRMIASTAITLSGVSLLPLCFSVHRQKSLLIRFSDFSRQFDNDPHHCGARCVIAPQSNFSYVIVKMGRQIR